MLDADPELGAAPHADLQVHTTDSDGSLPLAEMVGRAPASSAARFIAITDHSQSLTIANGMDEERLHEQVARIDAANAELAAAGDPFRVLRSMEMDVFLDGTADMEPDALAPLDLVLGAFHSKLRLREDQTDRYLATLRNPSVHVLAHPKARMYGRRAGLEADWSRVFAEAAAQGKAIELDATPARQDLNVELARIAEAEGVEWFSIGSDAHAAHELDVPPVRHGHGRARGDLAGTDLELSIGRGGHRLGRASLRGPLDLTRLSAPSYGPSVRDRWSPRVPAVSHFWGLLAPRRPHGPCPRGRHVARDRRLSETPCLGERSSAALASRRTASSTARFGRESPQ